MTSPFDYFTKALCINLDRRTDRWAEASAEFAKCDLKVERFPAIDIPHHGNAGCTASHREIWARAADGEWGERVLIFEDDVQLLMRTLLRNAGFDDSREEIKIFDSLQTPQELEAAPAQWLSHRLTTMLQHIPQDWDLLYLGGGYARAPMSRVHTHVIRTAGMLTTHAYAVSRHFAGILTKHLDHVAPRAEPVTRFYGPPDSILSEFSQSPAFRTYCLSPRLFIQRQGSKSDLNGQVSGFPYSLVDSAHERMV